jgi:hypothetical protein
MQIDLFNVEVDYTLIQSNQFELADTIRLLLYQRHPDLFELLTYDNDVIFLEPSLFYYFSGRSSRPLFIDQLLYGYFSKTDKPHQLTGLTDPFGLLYLAPDYVLATGYSNDVLRISEPTFEFTSNDSIQLSDTIRLNQHVPFILYTNENSTTQFTETISDTITQYKTSLIKAIHILCNCTVDFWSLIKLVTREISLFSSTNQRSMGAISYYGSAFINTEGQDHDEVFFVEDLAHQCGHIIFYTLTLHTDEFIKMPKETPMRDITGINYDNRSIYGAVHGLFTYTTILYALTSCFKAEVFSASQQLEAIARIGFFMNKFESDLVQMNMPNMFTTKGHKFFDSAFASFEKIKKEFGHLYSNYIYDNQPYIFNHNIFCQTNRFTTSDTNNNVVR